MTLFLIMFPAALLAEALGYLILYLDGRPRLDSHLVPGERGREVAAC